VLEKFPNVLADMDSIDLDVSSPCFQSPEGVLDGRSQGFMVQFVHNYVYLSNER